MELEKALAEFRLQTKRGWGGQRRRGGLPADDSTTSWRVRAVTARFSFFFSFLFFFAVYLKPKIGFIASWVLRCVPDEMLLSMRRYQGTLIGSLLRPIDADRSLRLWLATL
jgi:hypothetical protein